MATEFPLITAIPTDPPSTADPANFDARADAFLGNFPAFGDQINATAVGMNAAGEEMETATAEIAAAALVAMDAADLVGRSTSTIAVSAGVKAVTLLEAKPKLAVLDKRVAIVDVSDPTIKLFGTITEVTSASAFAVTVGSDDFFGAGSLSNWQIIDAAFFGSAATAADLWAGETDAAAVAPKTVKDAKVWVTLADAATVTLNGLAGRNFRWTIGGNRTLAAIANCSPNDTFLIEATQDGTGNRILAWASGVYVRAGGLPILSTAAGTKDYLQLRVIDVNGSGTATRVLAQFVRGPTT